MSRKMTQPFPAMGLSVLRVNSSSWKERRKENSHKHSTKRIDRARVTGSKIVLYRKQRPSTPITPRSRSDRSRPSSINRVFRVEFRLEPRPSLPDSSRVDSFTPGGTVFGMVGVVVGVPLTVIPDTVIFQTIETESPNYPNVNRNRKYSW